LGDKVSLVLAPLLAACGADVPMISGRGLGRTGGTLDKLEAIPGFRADLSVEESSDVLGEVGAFIVGASESIAPADRRLYALRDVTGTVESIPLITASILSKKLAAELDGLVMDVKVGSAAFMKTPEQAELLADSLIHVGEQAGLPVRVLLTDMDQPLGRAVGNALEVNEAIEVMSGRGPAEVRQLTVESVAEVLCQAGVRDSLDEARQHAEWGLESGEARERFERMVAAQGGRVAESLDVAPRHEITASRGGFVEAIDCAALGEAVVKMGGGRRRLGDRIDPTVGLTVDVRVGDPVQQGQPLLGVHCPAATASDYVEMLGGCVTIAEQRVAARPLVLSRLPGVHRSGRGD
jgi:pyrimidine-nucleoside phosphorylase